MPKPVFQFHDGVKDRAEDAFRLALRWQAMCDEKLSNQLVLMLQFFAKGEEKIPENEPDNERQMREKNIIDFGRRSANAALEVLAKFRTLLNVPEATIVEGKQVGLTDGELLPLLYDFLWFQEDEKKNPEGKPSLEPSTAT